MKTFLLRERLDVKGSHIHFGSQNQVLEEERQLEIPLRKQISHSCQTIYSLLIWQYCSRHPTKRFPDEFHSLDRFLRFHCVLLASDVPDPMSVHRHRLYS